MRSLTMLTTPLVLLWMLAGYAKGQADGSFWWLRESTDAPPPEPAVTAGVEPPCECVKYYLCVNGTISTSGAGLIDVRLGGHQPPATPENRNGDQCPDLYDVCCAPPTSLVATSPPTTTTPKPTLPPDTPCDCVAFINCTGEYIVSDGKGNTSLEAFGIYASHSACPHAFTVCCALEAFPTPVPSITPTLGPTHPHCDCVDPFLCDASGTIVTTGAGLLNLRTLYPNPNPDIECEDQRKICCNLPPSEFSTSVNLTETTSTQAPTEAVEPTTPSCGSRNELGIGARIIGFQQGESQYGEFPWVAAILRQDFIMEKPVHLFVGGGTLIHSRIIVTAAHKLDGINPTSIWVRLGEWDTQTTHETYEHQNIQVEQVIVHPEFDRRAMFNDIALLILKDEVQKSSHINHICLAEDLSKVNTKACVINGWGKDGFEDTGTYQTIMKSLSLPVVDHQNCQRKLRTTRLGRYFRLHHSFVCAGGELGIDACQGDGGGPLACPRIDDPSRYLLVGITAWGIGCGQDGLPGVYASIPANYEWILNETYGRYPTPTTPITTTPSTTTPLTTTTTTTTESSHEQEQYDYSNYRESREEWREEKSRRKAERKRIKKQQKQREKEERRQRREERERRRLERGD